MRLKAPPALPKGDRGAQNLAHKDRAAVAAYALGEDYHDVIKKTLEAHHQRPVQIRFSVNENLFTEDKRSTIAQFDPAAGGAF